MNKWVKPIRRQREPLESLAEAWLKAGADSFSVWQDGEYVAAWPAPPKSGADALTAPIVHGGRRLGELRATGLQGPAAKSRLEAEAKLVGRLIQLERDLQDMTSDLVETQEQLLALYKVAEQTVLHFDVDEILRQVTKEAAELLNVEGAFMAVQAHGHWPLLSHHYPHPLLEHETLTVHLDRIQNSGEDIWWDKQTSQVDGLPGINNLLMVHTRLHDTGVVVLGLVNKASGEFTMPNIKLTRTIVKQAGALVENVLLHEQSVQQTRLQTEMDLAQRVQLNLLPHHHPRIAGLDLWADSRPASWVGGDFYDFIHKPDRPFTFAVGDVSGKGMPAAMVMGMTRAVLRAKAANSKLTSPRRLMKRANAALYDDFSDVNMFATVFIGQYDPNSTELVYANAGHSPVIFRPAHESARLLRADGTAMGVLLDDDFPDQRLTLKRGDTLVVATDGFNEAWGEQNEMFGYDRLIDLVDASKDKTAREIADTIYMKVNAFTNGQPQRDDQTLLVLKRT